MNIAQRIGRNTAVVFISRILSSALCFLYMIQIARYLGPSGFGVLCFSLAFTRIFGIFTDFGLHLLTVREVSRDLLSSDKYLRNLSGIKIILGVVVFSVMSVVVNIIDYPTQTVHVVYCIGISVIINSFSQMFCSIFQAEQRMEFDSIGKILNGLLMVICIFAATKLDFSVVGFAFLFVVVSVLVFIYYVVALRVAFKRVFRAWVDGGMVEFDWQFWKSLIRQAISFGLAVCFVTIFYWIDSVMLYRIKGDEVVGWYNAAYRLVLVLLLIPGSFISAIYPAMSVFYESRKDTLRILFERSLKYLLIIGVPLGVGTLILAEKIIVLFYKQDYLNSVIALQILVWSSVLIFASQPIGNLFNCLNRQVIITYITGFCVILNVVLNLILIPKYSFVGASIATVATELFSLIVMCIFCVKTGYGFSGVKHYLTLVKVLLSSLIMGVLILWLKDANLFVVVTLAITIYFAATYLLGVFDKEDVNILKRIIIK